MLFVAFALILPLGPGSSAHAADMSGDMRVVVSTHQDGCDPSVMPHGQTEKHDAGGCGKMQCCLGAACVFAGLPAAAVGATPVSATALTLSAATAFLTGRDVAPPLDPPRPFA
jgi:hypothetical protein